MQSLDNILSGQGEAAPAQENTTEEQNVTQAATEAEGQTEQQTESNEAEGEGENGQRVPVAALQAERQKVKRYTEQVAEFDKSVSGLREQNAALTRQVSELLQRIPQPKQEPQPAPDWFENPTEAMRHHMTQQVSPAFDQFSQQLMAQAQMLAGIKYGDDKVQEAEKAFIAALQSRTLDPADYQRVSNSPNRYAAAVQWHQRQQAQAEIGDDPAAYRAKVEAEIRAKLEAEHQQQGNNSGQRSAGQQMPSNLAGARNVGARSGPAWSGPPSLTDIFAR